MSKLGPRLSIVGAIFLGGLCVSACGSSTGSTSSSNAVAHVGNVSITKASLDHWIAIAVGIKNFTSPPPAAQEALPDPPNFTVCIASRRAAEPKHPSAPATLKSECQTRYAELQEGTVHTLINADWVRGEAANEGIQVSDAEVLARFNQIKHQQFPKDANYQKFLATTHQSTADILFNLKTQLLVAKLDQKTTQGKTGKAAQTALNSTVASFEAKWKARTSCSPAYVIKDCKEFK
jgi:hypothetical protein